MSSPLGHPTKDPSVQVQFRQLLEEAITKPGTLMKAYSLFWNYSLGRQILISRTIGAASR
jgi:hypothetical protein